VTWKHAVTKARYSGKLNLVDLAGSERLLKNYFENRETTGTPPPYNSHYTSADVSTGGGNYSSHHGMTAVERVRERETLNINQSLSVLGKVFLALLNKKQHIPYRDSKLTHYLKDSLGGDSKTMLIMQVSPSASDAAETISTLNFGQRVSLVEKGQVNPQVRVSTSLSTDISPRRVPGGAGRFRSKSHNKLIPIHS
jgi:hypothetical protein